MTYTCNIDMINTFLKNLQYDFIVKPVATATGFFWICAIDNSYSFKVPSSFIQELEESFNKNDHIEDALIGLFGYTFLTLNIPSFFLHERLGFATRDYAEFSLEYGPIERMELTDANFTLGKMEVEVSPCSSLFYLLIKQFDRKDVENIYDTNDISDIFILQKLQSFENIRRVHSYTIKLKRISTNIYTADNTNKSFESFESLHNDLYAALYYLSVLFPTRYDELPKIANLLSESPSENDKPYVNLNRDMSISTKAVPTPTHPTALRYFYHADQLVLQGFGQEAILYYYKVIEHFFEEAWRKHIEEQILQNTAPYIVAASLIKHWPRREVEFLSLVVNFDSTHTLWTEVDKYQFSKKDAASFANKIYQTRNRFAHGKEGEEADIPQFFSTQKKLNNNLAIFRATAKAVLIKFGGIII